VPKRPCTQRAEWRLVPGKAAQRLSPHYQLDCDYGTPLITIFKESDGNEPVYLCEAHVAEVERSAPKTAAPVIAAPAIAAKDRSTDAQRSGRRDHAKKSRETATPATAQRTSLRTAAEPTEPIRPKVDLATLEQADQPAERADGKNAPAANEIGIPAAAKVANTTRPGTLTRVPKDPPRARVRDLTYGDSAKALVDEAIWNLAPGDVEIYRAALQNGTAEPEAAHAAGGQLAIVVRKISEYAPAVEALLPQSTATIDAVQVIHNPLEQVMLDVIGRTGMVDAEKDAAIEQLGGFEESLNRGLSPQITPAQALKIACAVGERAKWGASSETAEELKPAYTAVYTSVRSAIIAAVPDVAGPFERLVNLYVAKAELVNVPPSNLSHDRDGVDATNRV